MKELLIIVFIFIQFASNSQDIMSYNYTKNEGLPSNKVYAIYRAKNGYLWIATDRGISRYNGIAFKNYGIKDGLTDLENFFFFEDSKNRLWLGTYNGSLCYIKDNIVYNDKNDPSLRKEIKTSVTNRIKENQDGSILFVYDYNANVYIYNDKQLTTFKKFNILKANDKYSDVVYDGKSIYTFKFSTITYKMDTCGKLIDSIKTKRIHVIRSQHGCMSFSIDSVTHKNYINDNYVHLNFTEYLLNSIFCVYESKDYYYIGTNQGLIIYNKANYNKKIVLQGISISTITEDITGSLWASSLSDGIFQIPKDYSKIKVVPHFYENKINEAVLVGNHFYVQDSRHRIFKIDTIHFNSNEIHLNLIKDNVNTACMLEANNSFYIFHTNNIYKNGKLLKRNKFKTGYERKFIANQYMTIGNVAQNILIYDQQMNIVNSFTENYARIYDVCLEDSLFYFSTIDSVYQVKNGIKQSLKCKSIDGFRTIYSYKNVLIGINHKNTLQVIQFDTDQILFEKTDILFLKQIAATKFMYASDKNIFLLDILYSTVNDNYIIQSHSIRKDLIPLNFEYILFGNAKCYVLNANSLIQFPDSLLDSKTIGNQIELEKVIIKGRIYTPTSHLSIAEADASSMSLIFKVLFFEQSNPELYYSVINSNSHDTIWSTFKNDVIDLYNISPGDYAILIKNELNEISNKFEFTVVKPLYKRLGFQLLFFASLLFLTFLIFKRIIDTNKKVDALQRKTLLAEYKSLTSVLNPHFIFNTLSSLQTLIRENSNVLAEKYLLLFSSLIRLNMKNSVKEKVTLERELEIVEKYLQIEKLRFKDLFDFQFKIESGIDVSGLYLPPLTIQPIVENSIKHGFFRIAGKKGHIIISIQEHNEHIIISIEDNGPGLDEDFISKINSQRVHSLDVIQKRFLYFNKMYGIDIQMEIKNIGEQHDIFGTRVTLSLPSRAISSNLQVDNPVE